MLQCTVPSHSMLDQAPYKNYISLFFRIHPSLLCVHLCVQLCACTYLLIGW